MEQKSLQKSHTGKNLILNFIDESQTCSRYQFYASVAHKEGYKKVGSIFLEMAGQNFEHAKRLFKFLEGVKTTSDTQYPIDLLSNTNNNLLIAVQLEHQSWCDNYPSCLKIAQEEGWYDVVEIYEQIILTKQAHEYRLRQLLEKVKGCWVCSCGKSVFWQCKNCGFVHDSSHPQQNCPASKGPLAYFEIMENLL